MAEGKRKIFCLKKESRSLLNIKVNIHTVKDRITFYFFGLLHYESVGVGESGRKRKQQ